MNTLIFMAMLFAAPGAAPATKNAVWIHTVQNNTDRVLKAAAIHWKVSIQLLQAEYTNGELSIEPLGSADYWVQSATQGGVLIDLLDDF
jgi:hypothetical protein